MKSGQIWAQARNGADYAYEVVVDFLLGLSLTETTHYAQILGWLFLPKLLITCCTLISSKLAPNQSPKSKKIWRNRTLITIITLYLSFCIFQEYSRITNIANPTFHQLLDINQTTTDPTVLKRSFRQMSKTLHPDKVGTGSEAKYLQLQLAYKTLMDENERWAYERFGPKATHVMQVSELGLQSKEEIMVIVSGIKMEWWMKALFFVGLFGTYSWGSWICLLLPLGLVFLLEVSTGLDSSIMDSVLSPTGLLPFQAVDVARHAALMIHLALVAIWLNLPKSPFGSQHLKVVQAIEKQLLLIKKKKLGFSIPDMQNLNKNLEGLIKQTEETG